MISSILFVLVTIAAFFFASQKFLKIRRNILLGKDEVMVNDTGQRIKNTLLIAFGQQKMFKRFIPAIFHFFIYAAFLLTQIELIEILIDGVFNQHRFFYKYLGGFYTFLISFIEILSVLAFVATVIFLARRNLLKIPRFHTAEMNGWPKLDGNIILYLEILLLIFVFTMNGTDEVLRTRGLSHAHGAQGIGSFNFAISDWLGPMLFGGIESESTLHVLERIGWWGHILVVFAFLNYLPISKHLHIILAFPNTYWAKLNSRGQMANMPEIMNEVKSMMDPNAAFDDANMSEEIPEFGAKDIFDLGWRDVLAAYTCTECGRCTSVCPANITGKKLSPRKIMMDIRDRAEEVGLNLDSGKIEFIDPNKKTDGAKLSKENYNDGKSLFDYIDREEIHACTACNACVEACPVMISPLDPILKLRRYEILTESAGPSDWVPMFTSIENTGSVWQIPDARDKWTELLNQNNE